MEESYIKLFRKLLKWEWADDPNMVALWLRLLLEANYKPIKWHGITIERGQLVLSMSDLAKRTGVTNRNLRTCIQRLVDGEQIIKKSTNKFTILTICKYDEYQSFEQVERQTNDKRTTNERQTNDKRTTTIKEYKESKEREEYIPPYNPPLDGRVGYDFFGTFKNVELKPAELRKLQMDFGESETQSAIDDLSCKLMDGTQQSNAHYATLTYWLASRRKKQQNPQRQKSKSEKLEESFEKTKQLLGLNDED